jgi:tetratricopeptide (TPR) repeat protein
MMKALIKIFVCISIILFVVLVNTSLWAQGSGVTKIIRFKDGTLITGVVIAIDKEIISIKTSDGEIATRKFDDIVSVEIYDTLQESETGIEKAETQESGKSRKEIVADNLINAGQYDDAIKLLSGPCSENPFNLKLHILLATAQVEKCALLKSSGDNSYETLIMQPYRTAVRLHKSIGGHPELYYISAKSLWINNARQRAERTIKKALKLDADNVRYLILRGDICCDIGNHESKLSSIENAFYGAEKSYQKALSIERNPIRKQKIEAKLADIPRQKAERVRISGSSK